GNWPEVVESIACLSGEHVPEVTELVVTLSGEMIRMGGKAESLEEGAEKAAEALRSGRALEKFLELVRVQGGDVSLLREPEIREGYEAAVEVKATGSGFVARIDALEIAKAATVMGAGRLRKDDPVDPLAGIILHKKGGNIVRAGETLAELFTTHTGDLDKFEATVRGAFQLIDAPPVRGETVLLDRYEAGAWSGKGH
ncbi:MAG: thymidine phosphorylase, partial [Rhodothermales bacterium]